MIRQPVTFLAAAFAVAASLLLTACGGDDNPGPTTPTPPPVVNPPRLTAPTAETPESNRQLDTLRPTLTVRNGTSD